MTQRTFVMIGWVFGLIAISGCASTATGISRSAAYTPPGSVAYTASAPEDTALVVVRFPATVTPEAESAYYNAYSRSVIGGRVSNGVAGSSEARQVADGVLIKSTYFALSLYDALRDRLPEHTVLLSPHEISLDADGALISRPVTGAETVPSVLSVDFAAYSFPDPDRMMDDEPLTFGDLITPLVTVHADHRARAPTLGLMLASAPLSAPASSAARLNAQDSLSAVQAGRFEPRERSHDFVAFLAGEQGALTATSGLSVNASSHSVQIYPVEKLELSHVAFKAMASGTGEADPLRPVFSNYMADRIIAMLNTVDAERAGMLQRAASVSRFDPGLAALSLVGARGDDTDTRLRYATRMLAAERRFLAVQSEKIYDGVHDGEMGEQVREMLLAELDVLEQRREIARQQNAATTAAVIGALASVAVAASTGDSMSGGEYLAIEALSDLAVVAALQAWSLNGESRAVGENYIQSIVPALEEQVTIQLDLLDSNETITAIRFEDFRVLLEERYAASQRAIDSVASSCGYLHDTAERIGTWQGECEGGVASGFGIGVARTASGDWVEYYGDALGGRPQGTGYLIVHAPSGSYALEGGFENGRADGVMLVSRAGGPDLFRSFENGREIGPAPYGVLPPRLGAPAAETLATAGESS